MRRYLGFHPAMYGDLAMSTACASILKRHDPDCHFTMVVGYDYREFAPLLFNSDVVDRVYITHRAKDGFDAEDIKWINGQRFDHVFNPMQDHDHSSPWWTQRHQCLEMAHMHGLTSIDESAKVRLTKWFTPTAGLDRYIAFAPFPGMYAGVNNPKALTVARAQQIVDHISALGYTALQIGGDGEPRLEGALIERRDYLGSVRNVLGCKLFIVGDSGLNWVLSAYDHPVLGLYGHEYHGKDFIDHIQPVNPNAVYLSAPRVNDIELDIVKTSIESMLKT